MNLLDATDQDQARRVVIGLEKLNRQRRSNSPTFSTRSQLFHALNSSAAHSFSRRGGWHRGVLGIVASRLVDEYGKPAIVLSEEADMAYGSGRSVRGVNLATLLESAKHHLEAFGGHEHAVGLTIRKERIPAFRDEVCAACAKTLPATVLDIDSQLHLADAPRVWCEVGRFEPFGNGNPEPIFATSVRVATPPILTSAAMIRMNVEQNGRVYQVKHFGGSTLGMPLGPGDSIFSWGSTPTPEGQLAAKKLLSRNGGGDAGQRKCLSWKRALRKPVPVYVLFLSAYEATVDDMRCCTVTVIVR